MEIIHVSSCTFVNHLTDFMIKSLSSCCFKRLWMILSVLIPR